MSSNPLPSPQANMFQISMQALASTFEPMQEDDQILNYSACQPRMEYILENYNNNLKRVQIPVSKENLTYNENMLMLDNLVQVPTPAASPFEQKILNTLEEPLKTKVNEIVVSPSSENHQNLNGMEGEKIQPKRNSTQEQLLHSGEQLQNRMVVMQNVIQPSEQIMMLQNGKNLDNLSVLQNGSGQTEKVLQQQFSGQILNLPQTSNVSSAFTRRPSADIFSDVGSHSYSPPHSIYGSQYSNIDYQTPGVFYSQINMPFHSNSHFNDFESSSHNLANNPSSLESIRRKSLLNQQQIFGDNSFQQNQFLNQSIYPTNVYASPQHSYGESPKSSSFPISNPGLDYLGSQMNSISYGFEIPPTPVSGNDSKKPKKKRAFQCQFPGCRKSFETESRVEKHFASHLPGGDKIKPFQCDLCSVAFSRSHDLKRHMYIHSSTKPFTCQRCSRGFSRRDALVRHENSFALGKKVNCAPFAETRLINDRV